MIGLSGGVGLGVMGWGVKNQGNCFSSAGGWVNTYDRKVALLKREGNGKLGN